MYEHAAVGSALSVLVVVAFTLVFHEVERVGPPILNATAPGQPATRPTHIAPPPTPALPRVEVVSRVVLDPAPQAVAAADRRGGTAPDHPRGDDRPAPLPVSVRSPAPGAGRAQVPVPGSVATPVPVASAPVATSLGDPPPPRSAITMVGRDERLVDVAIRVYGTAEATAKLWRANRDRLTGVDAPVAEGWLLRTP